MFFSCEALRNLLSLGVDLPRVERDRKVCNFLLTCDWEKDIQPYMVFLHNVRKGSSFKFSIFLGRSQCAYALTFAVISFDVKRHLHSSIEFRYLFASNIAIAKCKRNCE